MSLALSFLQRLLRRSRPITIRLALSTLVALSLPAWSNDKTASDTTELPISGKFNLINHQGNAVTESSYQGFYRLVFFGFTHCPDICPTTMSTIGRAMSEMGDSAPAIKPLFISVDFERDTPERLKTYAAYFHPSVEGLTGTEDQIREAAKNFNTAFGKSTSASGADWYHSSYLYLMDKDGKLLDLFSHATTTEHLVQRLKALE